MAPIGVEAAKLAGLQIDLLQKCRQEQLSLEHLEWFLGLKMFERDALVKYLAKPAKKHAVVAKPAEKFALLVDLGIITVPDGYVHGTCLRKFFKENGKKLYDYNKNITDENFSNPSRVLKPGDRVRVRAFHQIVPGMTTSKERMAFLEKQPGNFYAGAQGLVHVFEKRDQLLKGKWYASLDEKDHLWEVSDGDHRVPGVDANSDGDFGISLGCLGCGWDGGYALLSFSDIIEPSES